jgi:MoxR-like ATPase
MTTTQSVDRSIEQFRERFARARDEVARVIVGNDDVIAGVMTCLLARGHVLLEGIPGVGKTKLVQTLAAVLHLRFSRIQFTPDLMPGDIIGTSIVREDEAGRKFFEFQPGPVFANLVLADEINRATPKTQSALLEAMQENSVSAGKTTHALDQPFFVLATMNPLEMEGTYPLPEAQLPAPTRCRRCSTARPRRANRRSRPSSAPTRSSRCATPRARSRSRSRCRTGRSA